jgi:hypothetical protein
MIEVVKLKMSFVVRVFGMVFFMWVVCVQAVYAQSDMYRVENAYYECMKASLANDGIGVVQWRHEMEKILIDDAVMADTTGKSYRKFFKDIVSQDASSKLHAPVIEALSSVGMLPAYRCYLSNIAVDQADLLQSKFYAIDHDQAMLDTVQNVTTEMVGNVVLKHLTEADFNHELYKTLCLIYLVNWHLDAELAQQKKVSTTNTQGSKDSFPADSLIIVVGKMDVIRMNGVNVNQKKVEKHCQDFLNKNLKKSKGSLLPMVGMQKSAHTLVLLSFEKGAQYETYIRIYEQVKQAHLAVRKAESKRLFGKPFDQLNAAQQQAIRTIIPMNIAEIGRE